MKDSVYKISLDINEHGSQVVLKAKQSDTGRKIHISLRAGGTPYTIDEDCYAVFTATKPDGSILYNACTIEGNEIIYEFTAQTCAAVGRSRCEIKLYGKDDTLITSPRFALLIDGIVYPDGRVESTDEFSALTQMVGYALEAKDTANEAAETAYEAATKANQTAKSLVVVGKTEDTVITLDDAIDQFLVGLRIFGKTTQDGTPTPDAPVELVSIGDGGSITVNVTGENDSQSMVIATPNGLPGIPVASGGNYTDANGQQWVCDEIDFGRGVYVQRVCQETITSKAVLSADKQNLATGGMEVSVSLSNNNFVNANISTIISNRAKGVPLDKRTDNENIEAYRCYTVQEPGTFIFRYPRSVGEKTLEEAKSDFSGTLVQYILATPIETPLSEEELAAYAALHTFRDNTTVTNDAGAYMELEYVMDAKKYIDSLVGSGGSSRLTNVTLLASAWKTESESLHSQVVTIAGVTPYSKVDLLPSAEQLAIFHNKDVTFVTENEDGVVTVYAIGDKPILDYTMQAQITEVVV